MNTGMTSHRTGNRIHKFLNHRAQSRDPLYALDNQHSTGLVIWWTTYQLFSQSSSQLRERVRIRHEDSIKILPESRKLNTCHKTE